MSRRVVLQFISSGFARQSLCFALASLIAFSCSFNPVGHVQADVDLSASVSRSTQQTSPTPSVQEVITGTASAVYVGQTGGLSHQGTITINLQ